MKGLNLPLGLWSPRFGAVVCIALGVLAALFVPRLRTDNSLERWLDQGSPETQNYERFLNTFGDDQFVVIALSGKDPFEQSALDAMLEALERLEAVAHVKRVTGIPSVYRDRFGAEDSEALREEFTSTPFYEGLYISRDHQVAGLFLEMDPPEDSVGRRKLMHSIQNAAEPLAAHGFRLDFVGPPALNVVLDEVSEHETARSLPIALVSSVIVLFLLLRSARATLVASLCGGLSVLIPMGLLAALDRPLTMVSSTLPPLLWVLSLSHSVHIITRYQHHLSQGKGRQAAVQEALRETLLPCTLSAVTTAAGFFSLVLSTMPPIQELGPIAAFGLVISLLINLTVTPALMPLLRMTSRGAARSAWLPFLQKAEALSLRHPGFSVAVFGVVMIAGLASLGRIRAEPNPLNFLPKDAPAVQSYRFVSDHLTGLYSLEVLIDCPEGWLSSPEQWAELDAFARETGQSDSVARVVSPLDLLRKLNQWDHDMDADAYRLPDSPEQATALLSQLDEAGRAELGRLVSDEGKRLRLSILPRVMDAKRFYALTDVVQERLNTLSGGLRGHLTGIAYLLNNAQVDLVVTQIKSFAFAFVLVFLIIGVGLRSTRLMLLSIPPNIVPILAVFALMPAMRIPLDAATVLVAGVALGISVDNTVHLLTAFRRLRPICETAQQTVARVIEEVGPAMIFGTLTSCIGFFTLCASGFVPIRYFGFLSGTALLVALAADLVLTPSILVLLNGHAPKPRSAAAPALAPREQESL